MDDGRRHSGFWPGLPVAIPRLTDRLFKCQWPYRGLTDRDFFLFFLSLFRHRTSVTIPQTRSMRPWYGHWRPSLEYKKKRPDRPWYGVRPSYGLWRPGAKCVKKKKPVWQTVLWPLGLKKTWSDGPKCDHWSYKIPYGLWWVMKIIVKIKMHHRGSDARLKTEKI